jgi:DNA-binding NtrC family response regulator
MKRILLIDDDSEVRFNLQLFLEDEGFDCILADSAEKAIALMEKQLFDLAIVDLRLPGMNGEEFILTTNRLYPKLKYIIHTGSMDYIISDHLIKTGMDKGNIMLKPLENMNDLLEKINKLLMNN